MEESDQSPRMQISHSSDIHTYEKTHTIGVEASDPIHKNTDFPVQSGSHLYQFKTETTTRVQIAIYSIHKHSSAALKQVCIVMQ